MRTEAVCTGPSHAIPTVLPISEEFWPFHRSGEMAGKPMSRCKACVNWTKLVKKDGPHGLVTIGAAELLLIRELVDRCGSAKAAGRIHGLSHEKLRTLIRASEPIRVQKRTIQRILLALAEQRKHDRQNGMNGQYRTKLVKQAGREHKMMESYTR